MSIAPVRAVCVGTFNGKRCPKVQRFKTSKSRITIENCLNIERKVIVFNNNLPNGNVPFLCSKCASNTVENKVEELAQKHGAVIPKNN